MASTSVALPRADLNSLSRSKLLLLKENVQEVGTLKMPQAGGAILAQYICGKFLGNKYNLCMLFCATYLIKLSQRQHLKCICMLLVLMIILLISDQVFVVAFLTCFNFIIP